MSLKRKTVKWLRKKSTDDPGRATKFLYVKYESGKLNKLVVMSSAAMSEV